MTPDDHPARALSFGAIAERYDRFRPGPPAEALQWILPAQPRTAIDIGAGTGALTRLLVGEVRHVIAVEPDPRMATVLAARVPTAHVVAARAEALPVYDGWADAVVGSSMWHWVDETSAAFEVARVLRPGGVLGLLWNGPDRSQAWLSDFLSATGTAAEDERLHPSHHELHLPSDAPLTEPQAHTVRWSMTINPADLVEIACTYSRFIVLSESEQAQRREHLTDLVGRHPALAGRPEIDLPMRCRCWRAERRP
jgi:SAM-dependent methyltransferase